MWQQSIPLQCALTHNGKVAFSQLLLDMTSFPPTLLLAQSITTTQFFQCSLNFPSVLPTQGICTGSSQDHHQLNDCLCVDQKKVSLSQGTPLHGCPGPLSLPGTYFSQIHAMLLLSPLSGLCTCYHLSDAFPDDPIFNLQFPSFFQHTLFLFFLYFFHSTYHLLICYIFHSFIVLVFTY